MHLFYTFLTLFLWSSTVLTAQDNRTATYVKLSGHFPLFEQRVLLGFDEYPGHEIISFSGFAPTIVFEYENGRYEEIELSRLRRNRTDDGLEAVEEVSLSLRFETGWAGSKPAGRMRFRVGNSFRFYYAFRSEYPWDFSRFPTEQQSHGLIWSLTPHLDYRVYRNLFFDLSPELMLLNSGFRIEEVYEDPNFDEQQSQSIDFYLQPFKALLRVGLSWRL